MEPLLLFVHVPKAGGRTFIRLLRDVYGRRFLHYEPRRAWVPLEAYPPFLVGRLRAIGGHLPYGFHERLSRSVPDWLRRSDGQATRPLRYIAIVRDPIERMRSYHAYVTREPSHRLHAVTKHLSPRAFFEFLSASGHLGNELRNQQCRLIGGRGADFESCRQRVMRDYHAVGALEEMEPFLAHLQRTLRWPETIRLEHLNRSPESQRTQNLDKDVVEWITSNNEDDMALHRFVLEHGRTYWKT
jgi:hypothetical protein